MLCPAVSESGCALYDRRACCADAHYSPSCLAACRIPWWVICAWPKVPALVPRLSPRQLDWIKCATVGLVDLWSYIVLFVGVAASWIGIPIVGGAVLAAPGVLAGDGQLEVWLVLVIAAAGAVDRRIRRILDWRPRWRRSQCPSQPLATPASTDLNIGERVYRRWGPIAVFLSPT